MRHTFLDFESLLLSHRGDYINIEETFVQLAHNPVYRLSTFVLSDPNQAKILTPKILKTAFQQLSTYPLGSSFLVWLFMLTVRVCQNEQRKMKWIPWFKPSGENPKLSSAPSSFAILPDAHRLPILLAYGFELEIAEIASLLNSRESTIQNRIEKSIRRLGFANTPEKERAEFLRAEIERTYPVPHGPPEEYPALIEFITPHAETKIARGRRSSITLWGEWLGAGIILLVLATVFLGINQSEGNNNTLPLFPTATPPLPEAISPKSALISRQPVNETEDSQFAYAPAISADGNIIVYLLDSENGNNLYVYDRASGQTNPIDLNPGGLEDTNSFFPPDISDDGRWIVFSAIWLDGSYFACPENGSMSCSQVVLYDREQKNWTILSTGIDSSFGNGNSLDAVISGNGRFVAFWSFADNLILEDQETCEGTGYSQDCGDLYIKDLQTGHLQRIRVGRSFTSPISMPALSNNGEWLVVTLSDSDKVAEEFNLTSNSSEVIAYHLPTGEYQAVNTSSDGARGNHQSFLGTISADGRYVAFVSGSTNLVKGDTNNSNDVFVHDLQNRETTRVSVSPNGEQGNGPSGSYFFTPDWHDRVTINSDGRWIIFFSYAKNFQTDPARIWCPMEPNACYGVYIHDRISGATTLLNPNLPDQFEPLEEYFMNPALSADGQWLAFQKTSWYITDDCPRGACSDIFLINNADETLTPVSRPESDTPSDEAWRFQNFLEGHENWVNAVAFSPDGMLASAGQGGEILIWTPDSGQPFKTLSVGESSINVVSFSPDGKRLAVGDQFGNVCLFPMPEGETSQCLAKHPGQVRSLAFSPDGEFLMVGALGIVKVWKQVDREFFNIREYPYPGGLVEGISISPDGAFLAAAVNREIWIRLISTGEVIARLAGHEAKIYTLAFSPNGRFLASGGEDKTARLWEISKFGNTWRFNFQFTLAHHEWVRSLAFFPDNTLLATGTFDNSIVLWQLPEGQYLETLRRTSQDQVLSLAFSPDGKHIATGTMRGLRLWVYGTLEDTLPANTNYFAFKEDERLTTDNLYLIPAGYSPSLETESVSSFSEAQSLVSFPLQEPEIPETGFTQHSINVLRDLDSNFEAVTVAYLQTTNFQPSVLIITQSTISPSIFDHPIGRYAHVQPAYIGGNRAEFVAGGWNISQSYTDQNGKAHFERFWDEEIASLWLRWHEGGVYFSILYDQPFNQESVREAERFTYERLNEIARTLH